MKSFAFEMIQKAKAVKTSAELLLCRGGVLT